jgi:hypothetical protein
VSKKVLVSKTEISQFGKKNAECQNTSVPKMLGVKQNTEFPMAKKLVESFWKVVQTDSWQNVTLWSVALLMFVRSVTFTAFDRDHESMDGVNQQGR